MSQKRKGQATLFIIIALAIVAVALLLFLYFRPNGISVTQDVVSNPEAYLASCIEPDVREQLEPIGAQGGYLNPEGYLTYQGTNIKYLCYTTQYYQTCVVQQPLIKEHVEEELTGALSESVNECVQALIDEYERRGYSVSSGSVSHDVSIIPHSITLSITAPMTVTKETSRTFNSFSAEIPSEFYDLLITATSIIDFESKLGDAETLVYTQAYPDLEVRKVKLSDGSKVYTVTDIESEEFFTFASRSLAWPPGYTS
ncbi:hypothetical protein HYZ97_04275 [Candidatus Pacearchaeota archaeon]|nr:hypothetical protein [Candidatus Pacearchaeota archaeon]